MCTEKIGAAVAEAQKGTVRRRRLRAAPLGLAVLPTVMAGGSGPFLPTGWPAGPPAPPAGSSDISLDFHEVSSPSSGHIYAVIQATTLNRIFSPLPAQ